MSSSANYIERPSSPVRNSLSDMNEELSKANMHEHGPDLYPDGTPMPLHITSRPDYDPRAYVFLEPELPPPTATHTEVHEYLTKRFCRSMCLSWHEAAAEASGLPVDGHGLYAMSYVHCVKLYGRYHDLCLWEDVQWSPKLPFVERVRRWWTSRLRYERSLAVLFWLLVAYLVLLAGKNALDYARSRLSGRV